MQQDDNAKCRRCRRIYSVSDAAVKKEAIKERIRELGETIYTEKADGLCPECSVLIMTGYDRRTYDDPDEDKPAEQETHHDYRYSNWDSYLRAQPKWCCVVEALLPQ